MAEERTRFERVTKHHGRDRLTGERCVTGRLRRMIRTLPLLHAGTLVSALVIPFATIPSGPSGAAVAAIFPPWWSAREAVLAATHAGPTLAIGGARFVVVVRAPDRSARAKLRAAGALILMNPLAAGLCAPDQENGNV